MLGALSGLGKLCIGGIAVGIGAYGVKKHLDDEKEIEEMNAAGPNGQYDDRFFKAFAKGFEETKNLDW